jgi:hypothetical protein
VPALYLLLWIRAWDGVVSSASWSSRYKYSSWCDTHTAIATLILHNKMYNFVHIRWLHTSKSICTYVYPDFPGQLKWTERDQAFADRHGGQEEPRVRQVDVKVGSCLSVNVSHDASTPQRRWDTGFRRTVRVQAPVRSWLLPWCLPPRCPVLSMSFHETIDIIYVHIMLAWLSGCRHGVDLRPLPGMNLLRDDGMRGVYRRSFWWLPHDSTVYVRVVREGRQRGK